tara:strand:+ start:227 stop:811 length:585 start_codon:yes stop_codon:yes gene_type:complete
MRPFPEKNLFIAGESYSMEQGWIEGALETCYQVLNIIDLGEYEPVFEKELEDFVESLEEEEEEDIKEDNDKKEDIQEFYTLDKLLEMNKEGKKIIALDLRYLKKYPDKFKELSNLKDAIYLYDLEGWLEDHPGGPSNLEKGIEANKYYLKDSDIYSGPSPIDLFANITRHGDHVIENYLLKENDNVKLVGYLKL